MLHKLTHSQASCAAFVMNLDSKKVKISYKYKSNSNIIVKIHSLTSIFYGESVLISSVCRTECKWWPVLNSAFFGGGFSNLSYDDMDLKARICRMYLEVFFSSPFLEKKQQLNLRSLSGVNTHLSYRFFFFFFAIAYSLQHIFSLFVISPRESLQQISFSYCQAHLGVFLLADPSPAVDCTLWLFCAYNLNAL